MPKWARAELWVCLLIVVLGARTHLRGLDFRTAQTLYLKEIEVNPNSLIAPWVLGQTEMWEKHYDKARLWFRRVLDLHPFFHFVFIDMGIVEKAEGHRTEARIWFEAAYAAAPTDPKAIFYLAEFRRSEGDTAAAEALYRKGAQFLPHPMTMNQAFMDFYRKVRSRYQVR